MTNDHPPLRVQFEEIRARIARTLQASPADETSISWFERRTRRTSGTPERGGETDRRRCHVLVRVVEAGRLGTFRTTIGDEADLHAAIRNAMAHARAADPVPGFPHLASDRSSLRQIRDLYDERVMSLDAEEAAATLLRYNQSQEHATLDWGESLLVVGSTKGVERAVVVSEASLEVSCGKGPGAGYAADTSRRLDGIRVEATYERARSRHTDGEAGQLPPVPCPVLLSPEAAATLIDLLSRHAFTAEAYHHGDSFLRQFLGVQTFDRRISLVDDATDPHGLPFPFDLEGTAKRRTPIIEEGVPRTPALDQLHAALLGLPATPHASAGDDARAEHLFLAPGELDADALLAAADGGIWIARFDRLECYEPRRLLVRGVARGVRRVDGGRLADPLPDLVWDESLLQAFGHVLGLGIESHVVSDPSGCLGAISTPSMALGEVTGLRVARVGC